VYRVKRLSLAIIALCFCAPTSQAFAETIVFIVSYHNVDYAKVACDQMLLLEPDSAKAARAAQKYGWGESSEGTKAVLAGAAECKTVRDTRELGRRLENELTDALAAEPVCAGITVIRDPHPDFDGVGVSQTNYALKQQKAYWNLHLDYQPGSRVFGWTLFPNKAGMKSDGNLVSGEGTASKAAKQICIVASGGGATIR
jgi:hypothetical protein